MTVSSAPGTGTVISLGSAATIDSVTFLSFATAGTAGNASVSYSILDTGNSEIGTATYLSSNTSLSNRTPNFSTNGGAAINASSAAIILGTVRAEDLIWLDRSNSFSATEQAQARANIAAAGYFDSQTFTSSGNFTTPTESSSLTVFHYRLQGAGGGSASSSLATASPGGGGGGAYAEGTFTGVTAGTVIAVSVGAAGTAGAGSSVAGGNGGDTALGAPVSITAGGGVGAVGVSSAGTGQGGAGGTITGTPNMVARPGNSGLPGIVGSSNTVGGAGDGASSPFGAGGIGARATISASPLVAPSGYGSGAGAAFSGGTPSSGTPGIAILDWVL